MKYNYKKTCILNIPLHTPSPEIYIYISLEFQAALSDQINLVSPVSGSLP